jgi:hypothetical protein
MGRVQVAAFWLAAASHVLRGDLGGYTTATSQWRLCPIERAWHGGDGGGDSASGIATTSEGGRYFFLISRIKLFYEAEMTVDGQITES